MSMYRMRDPLGYRGLNRRGLSYVAKRAYYPVAGAVGSLAIKKKRPVNKVGRKLRGLPRKKVRLHQRATVSSNGGSFSVFNYGQRKLKLPYSVVKNLSKNYYVYNEAGRLTSAVGQQNFNNIVTTFENTTLNNISISISSSLTQRLILMSATVETLFTNVGLGTARVILYDIIVRKDLVTTASSTPASTLKNFYGDETGGSNVNYLVPGITPFSNDTFTQFYKVLKMTHIDLAQGQTHVHKCHFGANKIMNREAFNQSQYGLKGLTCFTLIQQSGCPANDSTTKTQVSLGATAIDYVTKYQIKYTSMQDAVTNMTPYQVIPTAFTVGEEIVDIGSGTIVNEAFA